MKNYRTWAVIQYDMDGWPSFTITELTKREAESICDNLNQDIKDGSGIDYYDITKLNQ